MRPRKLVSVENNPSSSKDRVQSVFLREDFRNMLFSLAYEAEGSLHSIATAIGYPSGNGLNGAIREMWKGTRGVPMPRLVALAKVANTPLDEVLRNVIPKGDNVILLDWVSGLNEYRRSKGSE